MTTNPFAVLLCLALAAPVFAADPRIESVEFESHGVRLAGSLVLPADQPVHAAVVFIHGSGRQSRNLAVAARFAQDGIAALVYDKRGAGESGGEYEGDQSVSQKNIELLADDAVAAFSALAAHTDLAGVPIGFTGISQAGWIVPIAAQKRPDARFLLLWSSPVCKVSEEDIFSKYTADGDSLTVPSYAEALRARTEPYVWPDFLGRDTDSGETLKTLTMPGLWLFSDNDGSVPVDLSIERQQGHRFDYVLFSRLGHNNMGRSFATAVDWVNHTVGADAK